MSTIARFLHATLFAALRASSKWSKSRIGSSSCSRSQGYWSRTGGGGGAALLPPTSNLHFVLLSYIYNQKP
ncbi:hypothetical protein DY000_02021990 [Brassica cretica]|uniref:Secreted protein n=1 Tax=Brassica cretica TaxID=69181 RepID=A0ABQ7EHK2_BRACR|nr:hypothetical protein DY000_02021990 [Brassica cretica]